MTTSAISGTSGATGTNKATSAQSATAAANEASDRFLKLLVTQMQNQDPLNPMDNAQVTSQMAQINTVTGIDKLNNTVSGLGSSLAQMQMLQGDGDERHIVDALMFLVSDKAEFITGETLRVTGGMAAGV